MRFNLYLLCISISITYLNATNQVPVLSYFKNVDSSNIQIGSLVESDNFLNTLKKNVKTNLDVILVQQLNAQDLSQLFKKNEFNQNNVHFEPQVESAYEVIQKLESENAKINVNVKEFVHASDALMYFNNKIQQSNSVILTSISNRNLNSRSKRSIDGHIEASNETVFVFGSQCAAFFDAISFRDFNSPQAATNTYLPIDHVDSTFSCDNNNTQSLNILFGPNSGYNGNEIHQMTLNFRLSANSLYWQIANSSISFKNTSNATVGLIYMGAPYGMETPSSYSFVCTRTSFQIVQSEKGSSNRVWFYIERLQLQPINVQNNGTYYDFGRLNYCQGFFSSGIWMAISASLILTLILAFGVSLLFNVKPLDRFDDPKGKPLNIGAEK